MAASPARLHRIAHAVALWESRTGVDVERALDIPPSEFLCIADWAEGVLLHEDLLDVLQADQFALR
jgi:hypothetical protein